MDGRNCSQNRDQVSTSPLKGSIFIAGSFTERETEPVRAGADCWIGPLILTRVVETDRLSSMRRLAYIPHKCVYLLLNLCLARDSE